ncbi:hypothetical protein [Eisenibacter elegans]|uniref:hypothetical protein n=1 Tax=Eisenibacter elegans TaxID=997 RepID=UPI00042A4EF4|nr:hypothetical protein [Eisenibacter elegans]
MNAKHLSYCLLLLISAGFLTQCYLKPEFDTRPKIKFESIRSIQLTENGLTRDSIIIAIEFQDGDGDLGLSATDTNPPFQELNADGTPNEFFFNYFVRMFRRQNGQYVEFIFPDP